MRVRKAVFHRKVRENEASGCGGDAGVQRKSDPSHTHAHWALFNHSLRVHVSVVCAASELNRLVLMQRRLMHLRHRENMYLTSLPFVSVRRHGRVTQS